MTRSIFDPNNPGVERSGNSFLGEAAENRSQVPEETVDAIDNAKPDENAGIGEHPVLPKGERPAGDKPVERP